METLGLLITVIGGVASIIGAMISFKQAGSAKKSADIVKVIEKNIKHHRVTSERYFQKLWMSYMPAAS